MLRCIYAHGVMGRKQRKRGGEGVGGLIFLLAAVLLLITVIDFFFNFLRILQYLVLLL